MRSFIIKITTLVLLTLSFAVHAANSAEKEVLLKPFTLAKVYKNTNIISVAAKVRKKLTAAGYNIVGTYMPYKETKIFILTNKHLLKAAAKSKFGGFGAAIRVSLTQVKNNVQLAYNNPKYMAIAYQMKSSLKRVSKKLAKTLGHIEDFGGKGLTKTKLAEYRYGADLEGFNGFMDLAKFKSHEEALKSVEQGFKRKLKNMEKIYRIDVPGKKQSIFGVSLKNDIKDQKFLNDQFVMNIIDNKKFRRSAHLPYEVMVTGKRVIMLHPHFRLAVNFPDMHMFGQHSFGKLMDLPYIYEEFFIRLVGGVWPATE